MNILYVTTVSSTINGFLIPHINFLIDKGHRVDVACNIDHPIKKELLNSRVKVMQFPFQRNPLNRDNILAYKQLRNIVGNYDIVHTHTPVASTIVRLACRNESDIKVIYTAHGFHFYKGAPLKNWLVYYPIEKWLSRYTDTLITINKEDYDRAQRKFHAKKNVYIPGVGMNLDKFNNIEYDKKLKRIELGIPEKAFVLLSVGELNKNKNHTTILNAVAKLENPNIHYIICGQGPLHDALVEKSSKLGLTERVHVLGYRSDIAEICTASDVFLFPSLREGLGMAALEGMAMGLPIITSNIHGIVDYSIDGVTGYTCNPDDVECFSRAIERLIKDTNLLKKMSMYNIEAVRKYDINNILPQLKEIYSE